MTASRTLSRCLLAAGLLTGCDRAGVTEDCAAASSSETLVAGERAGICPESKFTGKDERWRSVSGRVYSGENPVTQSTVRLDVTPGWPSDAALHGFTRTTDDGGGFGPLYDAPFHYDLTALVGNDIAVVRSIVTRYYEPTIDVPFPAATVGGSLDLNASRNVAFRTRYKVIVTTPLAAGQKIVFFATGAHAIAVTGDADQGITLVSDAFSSLASIYAIAYDGAGDLSTATGFAKVDVVATSGQDGAVRLAFGPFERSYDLTLNPKLPPGYTVTSADVLVSFSRTSRSYVTKLEPGVVKHVPNLVDTGEKYLAYRILARAADGSVLDSGISGFGYFLNEGPFELAPDLSALVGPTQVSPAAGATVALTDELVGTGPAVLEHTLAPVGAGPRIQITSAPGPAKLPVVDDLGVAPPRGEYIWTTRTFPSSAAVEGLGGRDARRSQPSITAPPRRIVFP